MSARLRLAGGNLARSRGELQEAVRYQAQAARAFRGEPDYLWYAQALCDLAWTSFRRGGYVAAGKALDRADATIRTTPDSPLRNPIQLLRATLDWANGDLQAADQGLRASVARAQDNGEERLHALATINLALVRKRMGDLTGAEELLKAARGLHERLGDRVHVCIALANLGEVLLKRQVIPESMDTYRRAVRLARDLGHRSLTALATAGLA